MVLPRFSSSIKILNSNYSISEKKTRRFKQKRVENQSISYYKTGSRMLSIGGAGIEGLK